MSASVQVVVRMRPLNSKESRAGTTPVVTASTASKEVTVIKGAGKHAVRQGFKFDNVFGSFTTQEEIFNETLAPVIGDVLSGFESTVFAYGQTGTGKTHTMEGDISDAETMGIIPRAAEAIFSRLGGESIVESRVRVSYLEIYNEELSDLLVVDGAPTKLMVTEDRSKNGRGVFCHGLSEAVVSSPADVLHKLQCAQQRRQVGETKMNKQSSRSHCLFTLTVESKEQTADGMIMERTGKLHMCDLAGSECAKTAAAAGEAASRERERKNINQSLLTLGRVISALRNGDSRIPYRDSKLTRLLQESLGGRCKTCIIATVSPSILCCDETLSTLSYAQRAHGIKNKPVQSVLMVTSAAPGGSGGAAPDGATAGSSGAQSWQELEMKLHYMTSEMQEAQAALAKKHGQLQALEDRAVAAEKQVEEKSEALAAAEASLESCKQMQARQQEHLNETARQLATHKALLEARKATESALHTEGNALLKTLEASLEDREAYQQELAELLEAEAAKRIAAAKHSSSQQDRLKDLTEKVQAFHDGSAIRQQSMRSIADTAATSASNSIATLRAALEDLASAAASGTQELNEATKEHSQTTATDRAEMVKAQQTSAEAAITNMKEQSTAIAKQLEEMVNTVQAGDTALANWAAVAQDSLQASFDTLDGLQDTHTATLDAAKKIAISSMEENSTTMQKQALAIGDALQNLDKHARAEAEHLKITTAAHEALTTAAVAASSDLAAQCQTIETLVAAQRAGQRDQTLSACHAAASDIINSGTAELTELLRKQEDGLAAVLQQHTEGTLASEQAEQLASLSDSHNAANQAAQVALTDQLQVLTSAIEAQNNGNGAEVHSQTLNCANDEVKSIVDNRTSAQLQLLEAQQAACAAQQASLTEAKTAQDMGNLAQSHAAALSKVETDCKQRVSENTAAAMERLERQEASVQQQKEAVEAMVVAQRNSQELLVKTVLSGVETLLKDQVADLHKHFQNQALELTAQSEALAQESQATRKQLDASSAVLAEQLGTAAAALLSETEQWGANNDKVSACISCIAEQNTGLSSQNGSAQEAERTLCAEIVSKLDSTAAELLQETNAWGAANDAVSVSVGKSAEQNKAMASSASHFQASFDTQSAALLTTCGTWGATCISVGEKIESQGLHVNREMVASMDTTKVKFHDKAAEMYVEVEAWATSDGEAMARAEDAKSCGDVCIKKLSKLQTDIADMQAASETEISALQHETAAIQASTQFALAEGDSATEQLGTAHGAMLAEFAAAEEQLSDQSTWRNDTIKERTADVKAALEPRPELLSVVATSQDTLCTMLAGCAEKCGQDFEGQSVKLIAAFDAASAKDAAYVTAQTNRRARIVTTVEETSRSADAAKSSADAATVEAMTTYAKALEEEMAVAATHCTSTNAATKTLGAVTATFCENELAAGQSVEEARPVVALEFSKILSTTPGDEEIINAMPPFQPISFDAETLDASCRPVLGSIPMQQTTDETISASTLDSPLQCSGLENVEPARLTQCTPSKSKTVGPPSSASKLPIKGGGNLNRAGGALRSTPQRSGKNVSATSSSNPFIPQKTSGLKQPASRLKTGQQ